MEQQFPSLGVVLSTFLLFTFVLLFKHFKKSKRNHDSFPNPPPGPRKLPIIGNIHQLVGSLPHHRLKDLAKRYGPIMQLHFGEVSTVVISSPDIAKEVMKTHEINFDERPPLLVASIFFYNYQDIAFAPYGDYWRQLRRICVMEVLSPKRVRSFRLIREEEVSNFIKSISSKEGLPINLSKMFFCLTNDIIARASIGRECKNAEAFLPIFEELTTQTGSGFNVVDTFPSNKLLHKFSWARFKLKRAHERADKILGKVINERRANKIKTEIAENEVEDLLDVLLNLQLHGDLGFSLTDESIKAVILDMLSGGSDTSSTVLEWAMSEMLKNPRVLKKAQEEVRAVFSDAKRVDETGLDKLQFLKLIIKETLRLHPPACLFPRECRESCKINGYDIHVKTKIMINAWAIGRDPNYWTEAEKFYPERFLDCSIDYKGTNFELLPFGAGKRMCPGISFGTALVELPLARLLYHFDWKLANGVKLEDLDMTEAFGGTIKRKQDLVLIPISCHPFLKG